MQVDFELLPQQFDYATDTTSRYKLLHGGRGGSKSTGLAVNIYARARVPGACEGLFRQKLVDVRSTTLRVLLEGVGSVPPIIPPGTYEHNQNDKRIKIKHGGEIVYNGLDTGEVSRQLGSTGKTSSLNLSGASFDEAVEIPEANVIQVCGAVRVPVPGLSLQRAFACNPGPPSSWVARRWGLALGHQPMPGYSSILCNPSDNYHLPRDFIEDLEQLEGVARERYLLGKWVGSDGLVFDKWDRNIHVGENDAEPNQVVLGVDYGYDDPFVVLRGHVLADKHIHLAAEVYERKLTESEMKDRIRSMLGKDKSAPVVVDSSAPAFIESCRRDNINAVPCVKGEGSIEYGVNLIQSKLALSGDGLPRFTVDPSCTNTIREFETWERKPSKGDDGYTDRFMDKHNHCPDAARYLARHVCGGGGFLAYFPGASKPSRAGAWR